MAQENKVEVDSTKSTSTLSRVEESQETNDADSVIRSLNNRISTLSQEISSKESIIQDLQKQITSLQEEKIIILDSLHGKDSVLNAIDSIVYKQCLIRPLYRRYNSNEIIELMHCLNVMSIDKSYKADYETYYHLLENYSAYNDEIISFFEKQKKRIKAILDGGAEIDWKDFVETAKSRFEKLSYSKYYKKRTSPPWESITYLDEVIDDFVRQLQSNKLTEESIQELIGRLTPKS